MSVLGLARAQEVGARRTRCVGQAVDRRHHPAPVTTANVIARSGMPFSNASTSRAHETRVLVAADPRRVAGQPDHGGIAGTDRDRVADPGRVAGVVVGDEHDRLGEGVGLGHRALPGEQLELGAEQAPRPGPRVEAFWTSMLTNELISWITLPASFVTLTVSVNGSPALAVAGDTEASRWNPLEIARTCVVLVHASAA